MRYSSGQQTLSWFKDRYQDGSLEIKPPFQRKPVWAMRQKCYLVESILMGFPVPEIYIQQTTTPDGVTTHAIVDGQQRIRTILQFIGLDRDIDEADSNKFPLDKLEASSPWRNNSFIDLTEEDKIKFYDYPFAVRYLIASSDNEIRDMFRRLNKFLTPLRPQELRNATYCGPFTTLVNRLADNDYWAQNGIIGPSAIRRMGDLEFVSELLIGVLHGPQGGSSAIIDEYFKQYEDYEDEFPEQRAAKRIFEQALALIRNVFPDIKKQRWGNKTDFYTLFVAVAGLLRSHTIAQRDYPQMKKRLVLFAEQVNRRLADEHADAEEPIVNYVRAVEKGANDKARRGTRHTILTEELRPLFKPKKAA